MLLKSNIKSIYKQEARGSIITQTLEFKSGQMHINGIKLKVQLKKKKKIKQTSAVSVIDPTKLNTHTHKKKEKKKRLS
jgi:copper(I)-binding protein